MDKRWTVQLTAGLILMALVSAAPGAEKLGGVVGYNLKQIGPRLDKAAKLLEQDDPRNAKSFYDTAKAQWDAIHKDYRGKFDVNHPDIVAMQKRFDGIAARLIAAGVLGSAGPAKLDSRIVHLLTQIGSRLDQAGRLLDQGDRPNAKASYETAQRQWAAIHKDFAGKFDAKHPDIVGTQKKLDVVGVKLKAAGLAIKETGPAAAGNTGDPSANAPPAAMAYVMKQIDAKLDGAEESVKAQNLKDAQEAFEDAERNWKAQLDWNKGKYDPRHPSIVALAAKYDRVKSAIAELGGQSATAARNLPEVLGAIDDSQKQIDVAYRESRSIFRDVSSLMSDFDTGREKNVDKLRLKIDELRLRAELVNALLPDAIAAAQAFRKQYPDFGNLGNLVKDGRSAGQAVERLEKFPGQWLSDSKRLIDEALSYADENIKQFGVSKLSALEGGDATRQGLAADSAEQWVLEYSAFLLEVIPSIMPELPKEAQAALPEFVLARQGFEKRAKPMRADIRKVAAAVGKTRKDVADAARRRLERARFPKTGQPAGAAEKDIRRAWAEAIKDKKLLRLSIYRPYEERTEARWVNDHWVVNTYRYIGTNCLAQLASGKYMVYRMNFRNTRQADGSWSALKHWSVGHAYEILKENIDK
jgi:hypothetical protein